MLSWSWARNRLLRAHNFWLATTRTDGLPHVVPVWGIWLDDTFCFSTGERSRKATNLRANPHCVVCPDSADEAVIVEGVARKLTDPSTLRRFGKAYKTKYKWDIDPSQGLIYEVRPVVAFAFKEYSLTRTATRWKFEIT